MYNNNINIGINKQVNKLFNQQCLWVVTIYINNTQEKTRKQDIIGKQCQKANSLEKSYINPPTKCCQKTRSQ